VIFSLSVICCVVCHNSALCLNLSTDFDTIWGDTIRHLHLRSTMAYGIVLDGVHDLQRRRYFLFWGGQTPQPNMQFQIAVVKQKGKDFACCEVTLVLVIVNIRNFVLTVQYQRDVVRVGE